MNSSSNFIIRKISNVGRLNIWKLKKTDNSCNFVIWKLLISEDRGLENRKTLSKNQNSG